MPQLDITGHLNLTSPKRNCLPPRPLYLLFLCGPHLLSAVADFEVPEASWTLLLSSQHSQSSSKICWLSLQNIPESDPSIDWPGPHHILPGPPSLRTLSILHTVARGTSEGTCALIPLRHLSHSGLMPKCRETRIPSLELTSSCPLHPSHCAPGSPAILPSKGQRTAAPGSRTLFP